MECRRAGVMVTPGDAFAVSLSAGAGGALSLSGARDVEALAHALVAYRRHSRARAQAHSPRYSEIDKLNVGS